MSRKQRIAVVALPLLVATMLALFQLAARLLGDELAWYAGFWVYWPLWCVAYPFWILGRRELRGLFRHRKMPTLAWVLVILPPAVAFAGRLVLGPNETASTLPLAWVGMSLVNGTLEEILWRGVYVKLFPDSRLWGLAWPTLWFALWHFAPGWVGMGSEAWKLVIGAALFGASMGWVAYSTGSIRCAVVSHVLAGLVQI